MAKKGQKFNKYSDDFKNKVVKEYFDGESGGSISLSKKYGISNFTIDTWIKKYRKQGNLINDINRNRGRRKVEGIYDNCPNCGAVDFTPISRAKIIKNDKVAEKGYNVKIGGYISAICACILVLAIGVFMIYIAITLQINTNASLQKLSEMRDFEIETKAVQCMMHSFTECILVIIGLYFLIVSVMTIYESIRNIVYIKKLSKHGILVKNLPYLQVETKKLNYRPMVNYVEILYKVDDKKSLIIKGELAGMYHKKGTVDLLIDPKHPKIHYIDYEIEEVR